jgi:hypothetical protein
VHASPPVCSQPAKAQACSGLQTCSPDTGEWASDPGLLAVSGRYSKALPLRQQQSRAT